MLLSVSEAKGRVDAGVVPLPSETVSLETALAENRVLRQSVESDADSPPFDRSAMDGYAVAAGEGPFRIVGSVRAGEVFSGPAPLQPGSCVRVFTGAAIPEGAVRVVMQEEALIEQEGRQVRFPTSALTEGPLHLRRRGEEYRKGSRLLEEGGRIGPVEASVLAMVGVAFPHVSPRPRVAHVVTGGELVSPESSPDEGQIRDSNSSLVAGLVARAGGIMARQARIGDDPEALRREVSAAAEAGVDLLLLSGGAGAGETDFSRAALEEAGYAVDFAGVAMKPGKPVIFARRGRQLAFCLPGNPLSHYVVFQLFVRRALVALQGGRQEEAERSDLIDWDGDPLPGGAGGRETYHPCHWQIVSGRIQARGLSWTSSGHLGSLCGANGMVVGNEGFGEKNGGNRQVRLIRWP